MTDEPPFSVADTARAHAAARRLFDVVRRELAAVLRAGAEVSHVGATAVPGCLTKGDLDIVVRVPPPAFSRAESALAARFACNGGSVRRADFAAFEDATRQPHLGIQLVAIGSALDGFLRFVAVLRRSPLLVREYNALKRRHDSGDMARYRAAKAAFVERALSRRPARRVARAAAGDPSPRSRRGK